MPKTNSEQTLEDEQKVIEVLRTHAKDSMESIAKRCKFSSQKVYRIISKLEREKRIWGYSAVVDDEYVGMRHYYMLMSRSKTPLPGNLIEEILSTRLDDLIPGATVVIENIEYVNGPCDGIFSFFAKDVTAAKRFMEHFNRKFHPYIGNLYLFESVYTVRRRGLRNPNIKKNLNLPFIDESVDLKDYEDKHKT
jgi:DNA-binding Lrp family transcriptional regulator